MKPSSPALWRGAILSVPLTVAATWVFRRSTTQARDEAVFATIAVVIAISFARLVWRHRPPPSGLAAAAAVA